MGSAAHLVGGRPHPPVVAWLHLFILPGLAGAVSPSRSEEAGNVRDGCRIAVVVARFRSCRPRTDRVLRVAAGVRESGTVSITTRRSSRSVRIDAVCAAAVEPARSAAYDVAGSEGLGAYLGCEADDERVVTHQFASTNPGYIGWRWAVTVTRAPRSRTITVDEVVLLPGPDAILAPAWVPWSERVQAGDLGPGDLLPTAPDDPRLVPGYTGADESPDTEAMRAISDELGLGRVRVLSLDGRDDAAERWYAGPQGPTDAIAQAAPGPCSTCGFLVRLAGPLGTAFGVCANEFSPSDGEVVALDHGCGAHSEALVPTPAQGGSDTHEHVLDTLTYDDTEPPQS